MNETQRPLARREDLVIQEMPDEVLVYDLQTNKAHCLNRTAAAIWKSCDGKNSIADISKMLEQTNGAGGSGVVGEDLIWLAIDQLNEKNLLDAETPVKFGAMQTRRAVIKKVGLAAVIALPIVTSLVAPTVASAGSFCPNNTNCTCTLAVDAPGTTAGTNTCAVMAGCSCKMSAGTGTDNCPSQCTSGCSTCTVVNGGTSCSTQNGMAGGTANVCS